MRFEDVKVGRLVIPRKFHDGYQLKNGNEISFTRGMTELCDTPQVVTRLDEDESILIGGYWWPVVCVDGEVHKSIPERLTLVEARIGRLLALASGDRRRQQLQVRMLKAQQAAKALEGGL